ncbi:hypothetical protein F66182_7645 [Fusarium sp. NRRL 66182]|nr:hypothetical protein F66182_7645 [Fusarium sp. NRRL 66182]
MESLITVDPTERRRTQNRLAKRKSRTQARKLGHESSRLLSTSQPVETATHEEPWARETSYAAAGHQPRSAFTSSARQQPTILQPSSDTCIASTNSSAEPPGAVRALQTPPLEDAAEDYSHHSTSPSLALEPRPQIWHASISSESITYDAQDLNLYSSTLFETLTPSSSSSLGMQDSNAILCSTMAPLSVSECPKKDPSSIVSSLTWLPYPWTTPLLWRTRASATPDSISHMSRPDTETNEMQQDANPGSPLHIASAMGHLRVVRTLISYGANINELDAAGYSPIHYATRNNQTAMVVLLLDNGADVYSLDPEGCTPLYRASQRGNNDIVERLLKHGAQVC